MEHQEKLGGDDGEHHQFTDANELMDEQYPEGLPEEENHHDDSHDQENHDDQNTDDSYDSEASHDDPSENLVKEPEHPESVIGETIGGAFDGIGDIVGETGNTLGGFVDDATHELPDVIPDTHLATGNFHNIFLTF